MKIPTWEYTGISVKSVHFWTFFKVRSLSENILELCRQLKYGLLPKMISVWKSLPQINIFNWFAFLVCDSKTSSKHSLIFALLISLKKPKSLLIQKLYNAQISSGKLSVGTTSSSWEHKRQSSLGHFGNSLHTLQRIFIVIVTSLCIWSWF